MTELRTVTCLRCEHAWVPRVKERPEKCPRCGSYLWDKPK
jgi:predicted Zn-ribbon and HTH transcriptional regulator